MVGEQPINNPDNEVNGHLVELVATLLATGHHDVAQGKQGPLGPSIEDVFEHLYEVVRDPWQRYTSTRAISSTASSASLTCSGVASSSMLSRLAS